jgi:hypothetical protein
MLLDVGSRQSSGLAGDVIVEPATGAVLAIGDVTLSGSDVKVHDIAGDTTWAIGRWRKGTVTFTSPPDTYELAYVNSSGYYFVAQPLASLPAPGAYTCATLATTKPVWGGGGSSPSRYFGTSSGSMNLNVDATEVAFDLALTVANQSVSSTVSYRSAVRGVNNTSFVGGIGTSNNSGWVRLFDAGAGKVGVVVMFKQTLSNGDRYTGLSAWSCRAS